MTLQDFHNELDKLLYIEDHAMVDIILASIVANSLQIGDPVWLTLIGPSSGGKSQIIRPFAIGNPSFIHRIDFEHMNWLFQNNTEGIRVMIERPMVNPRRFKATVSALRALEATQIVLEINKVPFEFVDSKSWQKELLPHGLHGDELKSAACDIAKRMFAMNVKDADSILIAEYCRRKYQNK
jgi:hypothetical protein